tara:strand:+ start:1039 stop:1401 length:363 start_codon:yes stop_codon:yes gene_type:complete
LSAKNINLEELEISELTELKEMVSNRIDELKKENKNRLMEMIEAEAAKMGISLDELLTADLTPKKQQKPRKAKYRDVNGREWTGMGRAPSWLLEHLGVEKIDRGDPEQVRKLDALLVDEG